MDPWEIIRSGSPLGLLIVGAWGGRWMLQRIEAMQDKYLASLDKRDEALKQERLDRLADTKAYATALTDATTRLQDALERRNANSQRP